MTRVVITQPMYLPWAGFLAQLSLADVLIWLDDAQFSKGSFTNRVQLRNGDAQSWLTIALDGKGTQTEIRNLVAAQPDWVARHTGSLRNALGKCPHYTDALACLTAASDQPTLCDALIHSTQQLATAAGITLPTPLRSSEMGIDGQGWTRVLALTQAAQGTRYITGHGARNYLDHTAFEEAGIAVEYMDYAVRPWDQGATFTPYVTGLDLVARVAPAERAAHLNPQTKPWRDVVDSA